MRRTPLSFVLFAVLLSSAVPISGQQDFRAEEWLGSISPDHTLVIGEDAEDRLVVFQKSAVNRAAGHDVSLADGAFVLLEVRAEPKPQGMSQATAVQLAVAYLWEEWAKKPPETESFSRKIDVDGNSFEISGRAVTVRKSLTVKLDDILQTTLPRGR